MRPASARCGTMVHGSQISRETAPMKDRESKLHAAISGEKCARCRSASLSNHRIGKPSMCISRARSFIAGDTMTWCWT
jgi:hypothetical protein